MLIKSRIIQHLSFDVMSDIYKVCKSKITTDNNKKAEKVLAILNKHEIDYEELGSGTNRIAILVDGYVFKIALDKWGLQDNKNEYTTSKELQPFVAKSYECNENGLILVSEYVTVLSREEFNDASIQDEMRKILGMISFQYLLDDVGVIAKNFMNWGYRDDGQLVILDYAYIFHIEGDEMVCGNVLSNDKICSSLLEYSPNFDLIYCPSCNKKFTGMDIRRRIDFEFEKKQNEISRLPQFSYKVTKAETIFNDTKEEVKQTNNNKNQKGEIEEMGKNKKQKYAYTNEGFDLEDILNYNGFEGFDEDLQQTQYDDTSSVVVDGEETPLSDFKNIDDYNEFKGGENYQEEDLLDKEEIEEIITDENNLDIEEMNEMIEEYKENETEEGDEVEEDTDEEDDEIEEDTDEEDDEVEEDDEEENYKGLIVQRPSESDNERRNRLISELLGNDNEDKYSEEYDEYLDEVDSLQMEYKKQQYNNKRGK